MIGREQETAWLIEALASPGARVQVVGPAGVGKSTLARAGLEARNARWFALEPIAVGGLARHLATGLDTLANRDALTVAVEGLEVLVLDGAEAHGDEVQALLKDWSGGAVRILITSQKRLMRVPTLELGTLPHAEAMALFTQLSAAHATLEPEDQPHVEALVQRLDGWPLAIELAASRLRLYSPMEMLEEDVLEVLQDRNRSDRHSSLEQALQGSWNHLTGAEQRALSRIALVCGRFSREAFRSITGDGLSVLERLMDASLVVWETYEGRRRYRLLGAIRVFALRRLDASDDARERYAGFVLGLAEEAVGAIHGAGARAAYAVLGRLAPDLESLLHAPPPHSAAAGIALATLAFNQGSVELALAQVSEIPRGGLPVGLATRLSEVEADLFIHTARLDDAVRVLESLPESPRTFNLLARCLRESAPERSVLLFERAGELARRDGEAYDAALSALSLGIAMRRQGAPVEAKQAYHRALEVSRSHGLVTTEVASLANLTLVDNDLMGATPELERTLDRTLALAETQGHSRRIAQILALKAQFAVDCADPEAELHLDRAEACARRIGQPAVVQAVKILRGFLALEVGGSTPEPDGPPEGAGPQELVLRGHHAWTAGDLDGAALFFAGARDVYAGARVHREAEVLQLHIDQIRGVPPTPIDSVWPAASPVRVLWRIVDCAHRGEAIPEELEQAARGSVECRLMIARVNVHQGVEVAADGSWFQTSSGRVELGRRRVMKRLLSVLASHAGQAVELEALLEGGWPGEKMALQSGRARVHVAVSGLRRMGLRDVLLTAEGDLVAYALHATVRV